MIKKGYTQRIYSAELKLTVVQAYLSGEGSMEYLAKKYELADESRVRDWIKCYNGHKEFKQRSAARGALYMTKGKKTTQQERAEIVAFCLEHGTNYLLTVERYGVSYQQIYSWVRKYMVQSMSRVGRCIDNGPMEGFWGILKSEMYYLRKFTDEQDLIDAIEQYIHFYNTRRYQKRLRCMTPMEFHVAA